MLEIGSSSTRHHDKTLKLALYERAAVSVYWFVDPERAVIRVYRLMVQEFLPPVSFSGANTNLTTPLFPGFQLSLAKVFESEVSSLPR